MKFSKFLIVKIFFILISSQFLFNVSEAKAAEEIKIVYNIFSRTIKVNSLKTFAEDGNSTKNLKRIMLPKRILFSFLNGALTLSGYHFTTKPLARSLAVMMKKAFQLSIA